MRRQADEFARGYELDDLRFLGGGEFVCGCGARTTAQVIAIRSAAPTLDGSNVESGNLTSPCL
jgi:hypothetical protein